MNHDSYRDSYIHAILSTVKTAAIVGASTNPTRASNIVIRYLSGKKYRVYPVNPVYAGQEILGHMT
jgi:predicted CoA-binding protein